MKKLKKLSALVVVTLALIIPAFAGVIECPAPAPPPPSPAMSQSDTNIDATSTESVSAESKEGNSLIETVLNLLEGVILTLF